MYFIVLAGFSYKLTARASSISSKQICLIYAPDFLKYTGGKLSFLISSIDDLAGVFIYSGSDSTFSVFDLASTLTSYDPN